MGAGAWVGENTRTISGKTIHPAQPGSSAERKTGSPESKRLGANRATGKAQAAHKPNVVQTARTGWACQRTLGYLMKPLLRK